MEEFFSGLEIIEVEDFLLEEELVFKVVFVDKEFDVEFGED